MLQKMLALIHSGKFQTHQGLAEALSVSPGLVLAMADLLVEKGYLIPLSSCSIDSPESSCDDCSSHAGCLLTTTRQGWLITDRGEALINSLI